jgi:hypothetical protein
MVEAYGLMMSPVLHGRSNIGKSAGRRICLSELPQALQRHATLRLKADLKRLVHARPVSLQAQAQASEIARSGNLAVIRIINGHSYTSYQSTTHILLTNYTLHDTIVRLDGSVNVHE